MDCNDLEEYKEQTNGNIIHKNYLDFGDERHIPTLEESLEQCLSAFELLSHNQYKKALKICDEWSEHSLYHIHVKSLIQFLKAILTLEKPQIDKAGKVCEQAQQFCDRIRRKGALNSLSKLVCTPNYDNYTEEEVHSELMYAEQQLMTALMTFFGNQSIVSLVRGALRLRSCNASYKECQAILEYRQRWQSATTRCHFESGTRLGIGALNLVLSHLPQRVLKLLEFMGFSGSKEIGLNELNKTADNDNGLRHFLAKLLVSAYECYMEHIFGLGRGDLNRVQTIVDRELHTFAKGSWFLLFKAKVLQLRGDIVGAIPVFEECISVQSELKQLHNICFWELLWCHAVRCEWDASAKYASILGGQCQWSPATFAYQEATFLYMKMAEEDRPDMRQRVTKLFRSVPTLRVRYAGKTIPPEKYCLVRAEKYLAQGEVLVLPAFELFYIWNIFSLVSNNQNLVEPMIRRIDKQLEKYESKDDDISPEKSVDNHLMLLFMRGVCLKELGHFSDARTHFETIVRNESQITDDTFLAPEAALELGLCELAVGRLQEAKKWLERARKDYTGYPLETIIHFRVHCALRAIAKNN